ncbi:MAG: TnpV protein [Clostridiales bacterium]|nr:TnpV protein [Clostridiales bacterium]
MQSLYERMGGTYTLGKDGMYYPDLVLSEKEEPHYGKYGRMRKAYLKEHRGGMYSSLLLTGKLTAHLNEIDDAANDRMELLIGQMAERQHINETLKARDQMAWLGAVNNIRNAAEEIVLEQLIYN